ncbi:MAG: hypothetical protein EOP13_10800 [Pseudomonas sp.]|uniref:hypothetical protein n=1 Tax=Pseudomonas sp. TaxID=306 RepID=UPI0012032626|nr:hypothetical protein [Pseudomonas sp.]RZI73751.1 MAG: hypothetical protein EOP13_10800 [Pseudomonas sp.]
MELLQHAAIASGRRMQWICGVEVVSEAMSTVAVLASSHGLRIDLWRIDDWAALAEEGIACERRWRLGHRAEVGSRFERLITPTQGSILAITRRPRELPEMLRAFVPAGRRYLSLSGSDVDALHAAALRLDSETDTEWAKLGVC